MNRTGLSRALFTILIFGFLGAYAFAGGGQEKPTQLNVSKTPRVYIAPKNPQSGNTSLKLQSDIVPGPGKVIKSYSFNVYDTQGNVVWTKSETQTQSRGFFGNLFNVGEKPQIPIKTIQDLSWPGVDNNGNPVPDGDYLYQLSITDDSGTTDKSPPFAVTVDNTAPTIGAVTPAYNIFSPNGDGIRDTVPIKQSGSREVSWHGLFKDSSGQVVREYKWDNPVQYDPAKPTAQKPEDDSSPVDFSWDGKDNSGNVVPDGDYTYTLVGKDRAGNTAQSTPVTITVSKKAGKMSLKADNPAFSPNGDGVKDSTNLLPTVTDPVGLMEWKIEISSSARPDRVLRSFSGKGNPPASITFDGKDNDGLALPDGKYTAVLSGTYQNGNITQAEPYDITIDTKAPQATISVNPQVFGGKNGPTTTVNLQADWSVDWTGVVQSPIGTAEISASQAGVTQNDFPYAWNGKDLNGNELPDGKYTIYVYGTDAAGNRGESNHVTIGKLTGPTPVSVSLSGDTLTRNGPVETSTVTINTDLKVKDFVKSYVLTISDSSGQRVYTKTSQSALSGVTWDGKTNAGTPVPDGTYSAKLEVIYENGNDETATSSPITVKTLASQVDIEPTAGGLSPNGDGVMDTLTFNLSVNKTEGLSSWMVQFVNDQKGVVRTVKGASALPATLTWDGKSDLGFVVDGTYHARLTATYSNGLTAQSDSKKSFVVDTTAPTINVGVSPSPFSPDGDGINDTVTISMSAASALANIKSWTLDIIDPMGNSFIKFDGAGTPPPSITWDGKSRSGELVQSGLDYSAVLTVVDDYSVTGTGSATVAVDILVIKEGDKYRIRVPSIYFGPNTSDMFLVDPQLLEKNLETLRRLAKILNRYAKYDILIQGNAVSVLWYNAKLSDEEQTETLIPLSRARAYEVMKALAILGVDRSRMTIEGLGKSNPIVPFSDLQNRWKDRRVEFILSNPQVKQ